MNLTIYDAILRCRGGAIPPHITEATERSRKRCVFSFSRCHSKAVAKALLPPLYANLCNEENDTYDLDTLNTVRCASSVRSKP